MPNYRTKLETLITEKGLSQIQLHELIKEKTGRVIGLDRISQYVSGHKIDYYLRTAVAIATTLNVKVDDIIEPELYPDFNQSE